jgi:hypothetical protein
MSIPNHTVNNNTNNKKRPRPTTTPTTNNNTLSQTILNGYYTLETRIQTINSNLFQSRYFDDGKNTTNSPSWWEFKTPCTLPTSNVVVLSTFYPTIVVTHKSSEDIWLVNNKMNTNTILQPLDFHHGTIVHVMPTTQPNCDGENSSIDIFTQHMFARYNLLNNGTISTRLQFSNPTTTTTRDGEDTITIIGGDTHGPNTVLTVSWSLLGNQNVNIYDVRSTTNSNNNKPTHSTDETSIQYCHARFLDVDDVNSIAALTNTTNNNQQHVHLFDLRRDLKSTLHTITIFDKNKNVIPARYNKLTKSFDPAKIIHAHSVQTITPFGPYGFLTTSRWGMTNGESKLWTRRQLPAAATTTTTTGEDSIKSFKNVLAIDPIPANTNTFDAFYAGTAHGIGLWKTTSPDEVHVNEIHTGAQFKPLTCGSLSSNEAGYRLVVGNMMGGGILMNIG